jgi:hypothetical protein
MSAHIDRRNLLKLAAAGTASLGVGLLPVTARARSVGAALELPEAGSWRTWFISSGADLSVPPPPDSRGELSAVRGAMDQLDAARTCWHPSLYC